MRVVAAAPAGVAPVSSALDGVDALGLPGSIGFPVVDLDGVPAVYVLGYGRGVRARVFHVGQAQDVAERAKRYNAAWRARGLRCAGWCVVWPVNTRALTRTEAALQTLLLPERDTPKTLRLQRHHAEWLARLGMSAGRQEALYRRAWSRHWRRVGVSAPGMPRPWS